MYIPIEGEQINIKRCPIVVEMNNNNFNNAIKCS